MICLCKDKFAETDQLKLHKMMCLWTTSKCFAQTHHFCLKQSVNLVEVTKTFWNIHHLEKHREKLYAHNLQNKFASSWQIKLKHFHQKLTFTKRGNLGQVKKVGKLDKVYDLCKCYKLRHIEMLQTNICFLRKLNNGKACAGANSYQLVNKHIFLYNVQMMCLITTL